MIERDKIICLEHVTLYMVADRQATNYEIPDGVEVVGPMAFVHCKNLTTLKIPASVSFIYPEIFMSTKKLTQIIVAKDNPNYSSEDGILYNKDKTSIIRYPMAKGFIALKDSVRAIEASAFKECKELVGVELPDCLERIDEAAFKECDHLKYVEIPKTTQYIAPGAFEACPRLREIVISKSNIRYSAKNGVIYDVCISSAEDSKLSGNRHHTLLAYPSATGCFDIPCNVEHIAEKAFSGSVYLTDITVPENVTMGGSTFKDCKSLRTAKLLNRAKVLDSTFEGCIELTDVILPADAEILTNTFGLCKKLEKIELPDSVKILKGSFFFCESLKSITIPENVETISDATFSNCYGLRSIMLPKNLKNLGLGKEFKISNTIFSDCTSLKTIVVPGAETKISSSAFCDCSSLEEVHLGITDMKKLAPSLFTTYDDISWFIDDELWFPSPYTDTKKCTIFVPKGCAQKYREHPAFKKFENIVEE